MNAPSRVTTDERGVVLDVAPTFAVIFGWAPEQVVGRRIGELAHPDDLKRSLRSWVQLTQFGGSGTPERLRFRHLDGHWVWIDITYHNLLASQGEVLIDIVDVSREVELEEMLAARDQLLSRVTDLTDVGVFHADLSGRLLYANRKLEAMTEVRGAKTLGEQLSAVDKSERPRFIAAIELARGGKSATLHVHTGLGRWSVTLSPITAPSGTTAGFAGFVEEEKDRAATTPDYDVQTGALTREATIAALGELLKPAGPVAGLATTSESRRRDDVRGTACIVIRLRDLEPLTAQHGQDARDELLSLVGLRVRDSVRSSDLLGRTGEDEFAVLCVRVPGTTDALSISNAILAQVTQPMRLSSGIRLTVRPGIGVEWTSSASMQPEQLLARAQTAAIESATSESCEPVLATPSNLPTGTLDALAIGEGDVSAVPPVSPPREDQPSTGWEARPAHESGTSELSGAQQIPR
jgi:PAS domain S-box-containing protein/diguanylate cyclase (GGDEF)-like protein